MTKQDLINYLQIMPGKIEEAETEFITAQDQVTVAKGALSDREATLYEEGKIDGKNAEIRASQLKQLTVPERNEVAKAENEAKQAQKRLHKAVNNYEAYKAIAYMLRAGE